MKYKVLLLSLLSAIVFSTPVIASIMTEESFTQTFPATDVKELKVMNHAGDVEIISANVDKITVTGTARISASDGQTRARIIKSGIVFVEFENGMMEVKSVPHAQTRVYYRITVPEKLKLDLYAGNGRVLCLNHSGPYRIVSGAQAVATVGNCEVNTVVGDTGFATPTVQEQAIKVKVFGKRVLEWLDQVGVPKLGW